MEVTRRFRVTRMSANRWRRALAAGGRLRQDRRWRTAGRPSGRARLGGVADPDGRCVFVFAEQDRAGFTRWATARQFPAAWPQSKASAGNPVAISPPCPVRGSTVGPSGSRQATSDPSAARNVAGWPCPALGAEWERRSAASYGQTRSDALIVARSNRSDVPERRRPADLPT